MDLEALQVTVLQPVPFLASLTFSSLASFILPDSQLALLLAQLLTHTQPTKLPKPGGLRNIKRCETYKQHSINLRIILTST